MNRVISVNMYLSNECECLCSATLESGHLISHVNGTH